MKNRKKTIKLLLFLLIIFIFKSSIINLYSNITNLFRKQNNICDLEKESISILKQTYEKELHELQSLNDLELTNIRSNIASISFFELYGNKQYFYINLGKEDVKVNDIVLNEEGILGIVSQTNKSSSLVNTLNSKMNISVVINGNYGILNKKEIKDIIGNNKISINDKVYTSGLTDIIGNIYIGKVKEIYEDKVIIDYESNYQSKYVLVVGEK